MYIFTRERAKYNKNAFSSDMSFISFFLENANLINNFGVLFNVFFAVFNLMMGIVYDSLWYITVGLYYLMVFIIRFQLIKKEMRAANITDCKQKVRFEYRVYRNTALLLILLCAFSAAVVVKNFSLQKNHAGGVFQILTACAYTLYRIVVCVINLYDLRRQKHPIPKAAGAVNFSVAAVSLIALQNSVLSYFEDTVTLAKYLNTALSIFVFLSVITLSVLMIKKSYYKLKKTSDSVFL